jgi:hypothetical protein
MRFSLVLAATCLVAGCAQSYQPIIDTRGVHPAQYQADLADCRAYAQQVSPAQEAAGGALAGGLIGAALGAVTGAITNAGFGTSTALGAALGGTSGAASGTLQGIEGQKDVIRRCMAGRGYSVLR